MNWKCGWWIREVDVVGKRIFMRVDFNVPQERVSRQPSACKGNKISWFRCSLSRLEHWIPCIYVHLLASRQWVAFLDATSTQDASREWTQWDNCWNSWNHRRTFCLHLLKYWNKGFGGSLSFARKDKADPTKITNTQRIDSALPTIKKAGWWKFGSLLHFILFMARVWVVFGFRSWRRVPSPLCWHPTLAGLMEASWLVWSSAVI